MDLLFLFSFIPHSSLVHDLSILSLNDRKAIWGIDFVLEVLFNTLKDNERSLRCDDAELAANLQGIVIKSTQLNRCNRTLRSSGSFPGTSGKRDSSSIFFC